MTATELAAWFAAFSVPAAACVTFLKWYIGRMDAREASEFEREKAERDEEIKRQDELRRELREDMQQQVNKLDATVKTQGALVNVLMGHIRLLENKMASAGLEVPTLNIEALMRRMD